MTAPTIMGRGVRLGMLVKTRPAETETWIRQQSAAAGATVIRSQAQ